MKSLAGELQDQQRKSEQHDQAVAEADSWLHEIDQVLEENGDIVVRGANRHRGP